MASWPVKLIRESFFSHFDLRNYTKLSPNPLISVDNSTPLIDSYLNQFKRTVDDAVRIDSRRSSCYSLRCISLGDADGVMYRDSSHHCFTEVLGSWASGEYKQEAIKLSWELLTQTYKLPRNRIYIKYFGGNPDSCLDPDVESLNMWKRYVPEERILPSLSSADFWVAGHTGPCGPCVGILFDVSDSKANPRFVEIWRFISVQFNMEKDGVLTPLHVRHIITGMDIDCLASILQEKTSHYDSDVFTHLLEIIQYGAGDGAVKYSGKVGNTDGSRVDAAYRLLADHLRTIAAATSYCVEHGLQTEHREDLLKHADRRAVVFGHKILDTKLDRYQIFMNGALRLTGFMQMDDAKIASIVEDEVKIYKKIRAKDEQGLLFVDNPAMTNLNLHPSLPPSKKEKKNKPRNQRGKKQQQQQKRPPQLPAASVENEDDSAQLLPASVKNEDDSAQLLPASVENEDDTAQLPPASVENEDDKLDEIDGPVTVLVRSEMEISSSLKSVASLHSPGEVYPMRQIDFLGYSTHIIYQDENGPCPLISICNCLLFKGKINFECHLIEVPMEHLVHIVQDLVKERLKIKVCYSFAERAILDVVPTLAKGLDVDVKFNRTDGFSPTPGTMLFDCLEISLCHGWLTDEEDMAGVLSHSFESLTWAVKEPHFPNVDRVKTFLNGPQLTGYGLACLHGDVIENVPSVHYWNKHFSTVIKYNGELYSLVTDAGYLKTDVVWQTLNDINGGGLYMSSDFTPIGLELGATQLGGESCGPLGFVPEIYFKRPKRDGISLDKFILEPGNEFSVQKTLFAAGTPLDVAATTRTGRVVALDILRDLIHAHSTDRSYNGAFGLSSIFLYNGHAAICAPFCGECTDATMSKDFETYISDILELFKIDKVGLPAFFTQLTGLLRRPSKRPGSFMQPRYFWDCVLTTLALKPPLSRAGFFTGLHRIRRFASKDVQSSLQTVLKRSGGRTDWRDAIFEKGHPLLKKVLSHIDKSLEDKGDDQDEANANKKFVRYNQSLYSLSIFPRQVNEHGKPKDEGSKVEGSKQEVEEEFQTTSKVEGSKQEVVEEREEPFELLSDLDLLHSHYLGDRLHLVLELLLTSPDVSPGLWKWVREILQEYDKPEAMDPAPWDR